jgi:hypothetical protein
MADRSAFSDAWVMPAPFTLAASEGTPNAAPATTAATTTRSPRNLFTRRAC